MIFLIKKIIIKEVCYRERKMSRRGRREGDLKFKNIYYWFFFFLKESFFKILYLKYNFLILIIK